MKSLPISAALLMAAFLHPDARGQQQDGQRRDDSPPLAAPADYRSPQDHKDDAPASSGDRSILRHYRNPDHHTYGWRNPGGVGRWEEYYPPDNQFQNPGSPTRVATFDQQTYATSRRAQMQAQSLNNMRYSTLQGHIDTYGRPIGLGFGYGFR